MTKIANETDKAEASMLIHRTVLAIAVKIANETKIGQKEDWTAKKGLKKLFKNNDSYGCNTCNPF